MAVGDDPAPTGLARSLERAMLGAEAVVGGTIVVVGYLLPLAVVAMLGWAAYRLNLRLRRRPAVVGESPYGR